MKAITFCMVCSLSLLVSGCFVSTKPPGDTGFARVATLEAFDGCYANVGAGGKDSGPQFLSAIIWPNTGADHKSIEYVKVIAEQGNSMHVSAIGASHVILEGRYVEGTDFTFADGQIKLKSYVKGSAGTEPGNPFIGVGTGSTTLGLDESGNGRSVTSGSFGGVVFLVLPAAGHVSDAARFEKLATCNEG